MAQIQLEADFLGMAERLMGNLVCLHTIIAKGHSKRRWTRDLEGWLHLGQLGSTFCMRIERNSLVGRTSQAIRHIKNLSLSLIFRFHNRYHSTEVRGPESKNLLLCIFLNSLGLLLFVMIVCSRNVI